DLVEHAGIISNVPIFRSPDPGSTGTVSAAAVVEAVRAHALIGLDTGGIDEVVVTRAARTVEPQEIVGALFARQTRRRGSELRRRAAPAESRVDRDRRAARQSPRLQSGKRSFRRH